MDEDLQLTIGPGYPRGQLAKAFVTALSHEDAATRERAEERIRRWNQVLRGMNDGTLTVGSRTPVAGLPAWVTPQVVRGGFATGEPAAGGPLTPHETEAARRAGVPADRRALFLHHLTDTGLAELGALLDSGHYDITVPEEAALLTVAWLLRAGDRLAALSLLEEIEPFTDRLRFTPRPSDTPPPDGSALHRQTVGEVRDGLTRRRPNGPVTAMNEALTVWNPFADELLTHWLATAESGRVAATEPPDWRTGGQELLRRYRHLATEHTLCAKHRRPKENLAILRSCLEDVLTGNALTPRRHGLLQHAVDSMIARRGVPGSARHAALRERQATDAAHPTHHALARVLIDRLSAPPQDAGLPSTAEFTAPVTPDEAARTGVPAGGEMPATLRHAVDRALSAPVSTLVERGVVPSAEVLAELVPQLVAGVTSLAFQDTALRTLMAATHRAFANRRSLLLLNFEHQVRLTELPWVRAVTAHRRPSGDTTGHARDALVQLAELTLAAFPATILPNPLIRELTVLARGAGGTVPFTEELAADIFMGSFTPKFAHAARVAADVLEGTLYDRYYGIGYASVRTRLRHDDPREFAALCGARAGDHPRGSWVAVNGTVIEQAQILTTHNLAALVYPIGVRPRPGWPGLARDAYAAVCCLITRIHGNPRPLPTIKDAAYAWRQTLFFLALCGLEDQIAVIAWMQEETRRQPEHAAARLAPVLAGLRHVLVGGSLDDGNAPTARRFLAWSPGGHWIQDLRP